GTPEPPAPKPRLKPATSRPPTSEQTADVKAFCATGSHGPNVPTTVGFAGSLTSTTEPPISLQTYAYDPFTTTLRARPFGVATAPRTVAFGFGADSRSSVSVVCTVASPGAATGGVTVIVAPSGEPTKNGPSPTAPGVSGTNAWNVYGPFASC